MFPATTSNQITYNYFCQLGGISSGLAQAVLLFITLIICYL